MVKGCEIWHTDSGQFHSPHSIFEVASSQALVPPTGQSWTCIHVHNFWPIHPIFTNRYHHHFPPSWFMSKTFNMFHLSQILSNYLETWHTWCSAHAPQKLFFKFKTVWPRQPIKFDHEAAKQEVSQFLSSPLTYHNQTGIWDTQWIWWPLTSRGHCN